MSSGKPLLRQHQNTNTPACVLCARRKVKCDRQKPSCSNCTKHNAECRYEEAPPPQRHTKRRADAELRARISHLEQKFQERGIDPDVGMSIRSPQASSAAPGTQASANKPLKPKPLGQPPKPGSMPKFPLLTLDGPSSVKFMRRRYHGLSDPSLSTSIVAFSPANLTEMHPEPRHIFRLWQVFAERTNPMTKIVHAPSTQQRILDISGDMSKCPQSFQALVFAIYLLAVVSMSEEECSQYFGEGKRPLMMRYGSATWVSLLAAGVFETREIEVLQALVLFIFSDPASETATTLSAVAVRLGQKMGLDKEEASDSLTCFEKEMSVRLWWQICNHDILARQLFLSRGHRETTSMAPDIRLPLNVNDAELHPHMVKLPVEHSQASEMMYVLMRYEGAAWGQRKRTQRQPNGEPEDFNFSELESILEEKYLRHCDPQIPLHAASQTMARSSTHAMYYMRERIQADGKMLTDALFEQAMELLELDQANRKLTFATQLLWHGGPIHLDAIVHVLTKLRQPITGDRAAKAWDLIVAFWDEQINGDWEGDEIFFKKLLDLTMEAWQERRKELATTYGSSTAESLTPVSVQRLQQLQRVQRGDQEAGTESSVAEPLIDNTKDVFMMSAADVDFSMLDMPPDWLTLNSNVYMYNYGYWPDFSLM